MNDSEQYHTGRAAAYNTMVGMLRALLRRPVGQVTRGDVEALMLMAERRQIQAETDADERKPLSDEVPQDQVEDERPQHVAV
jgi:hypothetical protein